MGLEMGLCMTWYAAPPPTMPSTTTRLIAFFVEAISDHLPMLGILGEEKVSGTIPGARTGRNARNKGS